MAYQKSGMSWLGFLPKANSLITVDSLGVVRILGANGETNTQLHPLQMHGEGRIACAAIAKERSLVACGAVDGMVYAWSFETPERRLAVPAIRASDGEVRCVALSTDGAVLLTGDNKGSIKCWKYNGFQFDFWQEMHHHQDAPISGLEISENAAWGASFDSQDRLFLFGIEDPGVSSHPTPLIGHTGVIRKIRFMANDTRLVTLSVYDKSMRLWEVSSGVCIATMAHPLDAEGIAVSPDGRWIATGCDDHAVRLWDVSSVSRPSSCVVLPGHADEIWVLDFSADGRWLVSGSNDKTARIWDLASPCVCNTARILRGHDASVRWIATDASEKWVFTGSADGAIRRWRLNSPEPEHSYPLVLPDIDFESYYANRVAFSPDGHWLVSTDNGNSTRVWEVDADGKFRGKPLLLLHDHAVTHADFGGSSRDLFSCDMAGTVRRWDLNANDPATSGRVVTSIAKSGRNEAGFLSYITMRISRNGKRVFYIDSAKDVMTCALTAGAVPIRVELVRRPGVTVQSLCLDKVSDKYLCAGYSDGVLMKWNLGVDGVPVPGPQTWQLKSSANCLASSRDGLRVVCGCTDGAAVIIPMDPERSDEPMLAFRGNKTQLADLWWSPDDSQLYSLDFEGTVLCWCTATGEVVYAMRGIAVWSISISPDGRFAALGGRFRAPKLMYLRLEDLLSLGRSKVGRELYPDERLQFGLGN